MILRFSVRNDKHIGTNNVGTQGKIRAICAPKLLFRTTFTEEFRKHKY